jgi:hypothetical protein
LRGSRIVGRLLDPAPPGPGIRVNPPRLCADPREVRTDRAVPDPPLTGVHPMRALSA